MHRVNDNKRPIEQIFVAKASTSTSSGGGDPLVLPATGLVDLVDGEIGVYDSKGYGTNTSNDKVTAGNTVVHSREVFVVQGNPSASDPTFTEPYPLPTRPFEASEAISSHDRIIYTYRAAALPTQEMVLVGGVVAAADAINVLDETDYSMRIAIKGRDIDEMYAGQTGKSPGFSVTYLSKDYTALGDTAAEATDDIIQNLVYKINQNSAAIAMPKGFQPKKPIIAFAVDSTGTEGVDPLTTTPGTAVPVMNTANGLKTLIFSQAIINSFIESTTWISGATIVPVDLSLAGGLAAAGVDLEDAAGNAYDTGVIVSGKADHILVMATDRKPSYEDRIPFYKYHFDLGLTAGFNYQTVGNVKIQVGFEGEGSKAQWSNYWKNTAGQRIYSAYRGFDGLRIDARNPVTDDLYDACIVEHYKVDSVANDKIVKPFKVIILIPVEVAYVEAEGETPASFTLTPDSGAKAVVDNTLQPWIASTDHPIVSVLG